MNINYVIAALIGAVFGIAGYVWYTSDHTPAGTTGTAVPDKPTAAAPAGGEIVESFFVEFPRGGVALTNSGEMFIAPFPAGIPRFTEPALKTSMGILAKAENANGEVIGFASELEVFPANTGEKFMQGETVWDTVWTVVIPGRGTLFLAQQERSGTFASEILGPALAHGEGWEGEYDMTSTVGPRADGRGIITGGTGEFEGAGGAFTETSHFTKFTIDGSLETIHELRIFRESLR